jgi:prepilin-type N-terminal cleavage/methylation domain-containing protein
MNVILEKQMANRGKRAGALLFPSPGGALRSGGVVMRQRTGFTLVEVIVVLVILAILAAIAIPALTGYIDKAEWKEMELRVKTQMTGIQSMLNEQYAAGGFRIHAGDAINADDLFRQVEYLTYESNNIGINVVHFTPKGLEEYVSLTGDTQSNFMATHQYPTDGIHWTFNARCDLSGSIKVYHAASWYYFPNGQPRRHLTVFYVADAESSDPVTRRYLDSATNISDGLVLPSGFSVWRWGAVTPMWERIY